MPKNMDNDSIYNKNNICLPNGEMTMGTMYFYGNDHLHSLICSK